MPGRSRRPELRRKQTEKTTFVLTPLGFNPKRGMEHKGQIYDKVKAMARRFAGGGYEGVGFFEFLERCQVGKQRKYGFLLDTGRLYELASIYKFFEEIQNFYLVGDVRIERAGVKEALQLISQLRELGFGVRIQNSDEQMSAAFIRAAQIAGAEKVAGHGIPTSIPGTLWARNQWTKFGETKEKRTYIDEERPMRVHEQSSSFGDGGIMVQMGPKDFLIAEKDVNDPRAKAYEKLGYRFQPMPPGFVLDRTMTDLLGAKIFTTTSHLDMSIFGIPEKRIAAVCPYYYSEHENNVHLMERNFREKLVIIPEEEADRHPANSLPLGNGRVLVDSGAPKFIQRLRNAGAEVIPTKVPLDALLDFKGGLRCLFNED